MTADDAQTHFDPPINDMAYTREKSVIITWYKGTVFYNYFRLIDGHETAAA
jgi:hypothetical protein